MHILIASEQPIFCEGLQRVLSGLNGAPEIETCHTLSEAQNRIREGGPFDLVLVDLPHPLHTEEAARLVGLLQDGGKDVVAVMCDLDRPAIVRAVMDQGAKGFIPKTLGSDLFLNAVRLMLAGGRFVPESLLSGDGEGFSEPSKRFTGQGLEKLTRRQLEVLEQLAHGRSNQSIADALGISVATVKLHVNAILQTLSVPNRTSAALIAKEAGLADGHGPVERGG